jgi:hypothetical protein
MTAMLLLAFAKATWKRLARLGTKRKKIPRFPLRPQ